MRRFKTKEEAVGYKNLLTEEGYEDVTINYTLLPTTHTYDSKEKKITATESGKEWVGILW